MNATETLNWTVLIYTLLTSRFWKNFSNWRYGRKRIEHCAPRLNCFKWYALLSISFSNVTVELGARCIGYSWFSLGFRSGFRLLLIGATNLSNLIAAHCVAVPLPNDSYYSRAKLCSNYNFPIQVDTVHAHSVNRASDRTMCSEPVICLM